MEDYIFIKTLIISFAILVLHVTMKIVHNFWWKPQKIEKLLRQQGIRGTSYKFLNGDMPEMIKSALESSSKPMPLNHQIVPRVIPFLHQMLQQYGNGTSNFKQLLQPDTQRWQQLVKPKGSCEVDVFTELSVLSGDIIARTAFGSNYQEGKKIFELQQEQALSMREVYWATYITGFRFIPTRKNKRRYQIYDQINAMLREMIKRKEHSMKTGALESNDLLSLLLLESKEESKNSLTIEDIIEECKLLYFAGQETTTNLLTWTMIVLSMHPNWQEKARGEVLDICGKTTPALDTINRLKTVTMILHEVLRLYTPLPYLERYTMCETRIGNMTIPAGVQLEIPLMLIHYDKMYWENPEEFNPERFSEGVSKASHDQVAFFAFSWGPRICLGQNLALLEAKIALTMILQHFSFQLSPSYSHSPHLNVTLKPQHGAPIIIHPI